MTWKILSTVSRESFLRPCLIKRAHPPEVLLAEPWTKLLGQVSRETLHQLLAIVVRSLATPHLRFDNASPDLPISRGH